MVSARAFQCILEIVRIWWMSGFLVNGQYALTDVGDRIGFLRQYVLGYLRFCPLGVLESQRRGALHIHSYAEWLRAQFKFQQQLIRFEHKYELDEGEEQT
eukprot:4425548-Karenia_brevis.AAC.1